MAAKYIDESTNHFTSPNETTILERIFYLIDNDENIPLVPFDEAVTPLIPFVPKLNQMVSTVRKDHKIVKDGLTIDESMSIALYTIDWKPRDKSFHVIFNTVLQTAN